jgi:hypothetical protein
MRGRLPRITCKKMSLVKGYKKEKRKNVLLRDKGQLFHHKTLCEEEEM